MGERTKVCTACGEAKPLSSFGHKGYNADGSRAYQPRCRLCTQEYDKARKADARQRGQAEPVRRHVAPPPSTDDRDRRIAELEERVRELEGVPGREWGGSFDREQWAARQRAYAGLARAVRVLYMSDHHIPDHDPQALSLVEQIAAWWRPDAGVFGGDVFGMDAISRYNAESRQKAQAKRSVLKSVAEPWFAHIDRLETASPDTDWFYEDGNHTGPRMLDYLDKNPEFEGDIIEAYVELVRAGGRVLYAGTVEEIQVGVLFMHHGRRYGEHPALNSLIKDLGGGQPVIQGHTHQPQLVTKRVRTLDGMGYRVVQSAVSGCLCRLPAAYVADRTAESRWLHGIVLAHVEMDTGALVNLQQVVFHRRADGTLVAYVGREHFEAEPVP